MKLHGRKHILFEGTKILQANQINNEKCLALVIRTGFSSVKGQMIRTMLFPITKKDNFSVQAGKYLTVYSGISFIFYVIMLYKMVIDDLGPIFYILRFLDVVLWIIPPFLQLYLALPVTISVFRLNSKGIIVYNYNYIIIYLFVFLKI